MRFVYLHGFASSPNSRKAQAFRTAFAGRSLDLEIPMLDEGNFPQLTISGQLTVVESLLQNEPVTLIGSSMGGYVAALYASRHPETSKMVLLAPAFGFARHWSATISPILLKNWQNSGWREVFHYGTGTMVPIHYGLLEDALRYPDYPDACLPSLIFHGLRDDIVPITLSQKFVDLHKTAHLVPLASDHELTDALDLIISRALSFVLAP